MMGTVNHIDMRKNKRKGTQSNSETQLCNMEQIVAMLFGKW